MAALLAYVADLRRHGRDAAADKAEEQFKTVLGFDAKEECYKDVGGATNGLTRSVLQSSPTTKRPQG